MHDFIHFDCSKIFRMGCFNNSFLYERRSLSSEPTKPCLESFGAIPIFLPTMALENMLESWERFSLTVEEDSTEVDVDRQAALVTSQSLGFSLIGKLFAPRIISGEVMKHTFKSAWNIPNGLMVEKMGANLFLFSFRTKSDQTRVLRQEPWLFDKFLLVLSKPIPMVKPTAMVFQFATFWVHFCDLLMDLYNRSMAERLGNAIGQFQEYDNEGRGYGWKESLRVRIILDITHPFRRGIKVWLDDSLGSVWSPIKYEKLPKICAYCGRIEHGTRDCPFSLIEDGSASRRQEYEMWMAFSGRLSHVFRSPTTSPRGSNRILSEVTQNLTDNQVLNREGATRQEMIPNL